MPISTWLVMWLPPPHQQIISAAHPVGHDCEVCTIHYPARVDARRFTRWGAERAHARRVLSWRVGRFWIEANGRGTRAAVEGVFLVAERQRLRVALDLLWGELDAEQYRHVREHYPEIADLCVRVHEEVCHGGV